MQPATISDIYENNNKVRRRLLETVSALTNDQLSARPSEEKWSIAQIVDHVSLVNGGMYKICSRLLSKAKEDGRRSTGVFDLDGFRSKAAGIADVKLEAPGIVHPAEARPLEDSIRMLDENAIAFEGLRQMFEEFDANSPKFLHPFLGELSAVEWLMLAGGHEARHLAQIKRIIDQLEPATGAE
ncbi:MAG TPA: DinB family protein [Pyrinomonadaceae bacterium]|nr:DinB family protein [Pyrinomonadaceae bacterium]